MVAARQALASIHGSEQRAGRLRPGGLGGWGGRGAGLGVWVWGGGWDLGQRGVRGGGRSRENLSGCPKIPCDVQSHLVGLELVWSVGKWLDLFEPMSGSERGTGKEE